MDGDARDVDGEDLIEVDMDQQIENADDNHVGRDDAVKMQEQF